MSEYLTLEGWQKLKEELDYLEKVKRKEVAKKLKETAEQGDLRENAGYEAAKEEQSFVETRIKELKQILAQAKIVQRQSNEKVQLGSTVKLVSQEKGKKKDVLVVTLVGPAEVDVIQGKISIESPLGQAIVNKKQGDKIEIEALGGKKRYQIAEIK
ncbi:MAG: transcription elongation factor GreA [Minisyncoccales bacterium]